jgi:5-methylcytosine-specific restriction protein B
MSSLETLTRLIMDGLPSGEAKSVADEQTKAAITGIFGERYQSRSQYAKRSVLMASDDNVSFAGLLHQDSPNSGPYGGTSMIWFPVAANDDSAGSSLLTLVCGTRGLAPDENILGRPGHIRNLRALQGYLKNKTGLSCWVKHNPTDLGEPFPKVVQQDLSKFDSAIKRYGNHIYFAMHIPHDFDRAAVAVSSLLDLYAWERGWTPLKASSPEIEQFKLSLRSFMFPRVTAADITQLLKHRRFVILQGPPGCGKTRIATEILKQDFSGNGFSVQFHPAVSYESFVAGISPRVDGNTLNFEVKPGWLVQAIRQSANKPFLLLIDEINRADLSRVLGEAIFLLEPREISEGVAREVRLANRLESGEESISIPSNLYILGTMNSADRSIAIMDMAVRRRFAFVDIWPDISVVDSQNIPLASDAFSKLQDIFIQYATQDAFALLPGHSYFLADSEKEFSSRMKYELLPLLNEYLLEGRLNSFESELRAYMDWLSAEIQI